MKFIAILVFNLLFGALGMAQGVEFFKGSFAEAKELAKKENKLIFIDAYTTWCGPCKLMTAKIFPLETAGKAYNPKFVSLKIDMEKGEGIDLAKQYQVRYYPTLLFVDADGNLAHSAVGFHEETAFIELGNIATDPSKQLSQLTKRYNEGNRTPELLKNYVNALNASANPNAAKIADEYLATQSNWKNMDNAKLIYSIVQTADSKAFDFLFKNKAWFITQFGEKPIEQKIQRCILGTAESMAKNKDEKTHFEEIKPMFKKYFGDDDEKYIVQYKMDYLANTGSWDNYIETAQQLISLNPNLGPEMLNQIAWTAYEYVKDTEKLKLALAWAEKSVSLAPSGYNYDTMAALQYKLGLKSKAKKSAKKAIKLLQDAGEDASETEKLLLKINGKDNDNNKDNKDNKDNK